MKFSIVLDLQNSREGSTQSANILHPVSPIINTLYQIGIFAVMNEAISIRYYYLSPYLRFPSFLPSVLLLFQTFHPGCHSIVMSS